MKLSENFPTIRSRLPRHGTYRTFPLKWRIVRVVRYLERRGAHSASTATTVRIADGRPMADARAVTLARGAILEPKASQYYLSRSRGEMMRWRARFLAAIGFGTVALGAAVCWLVRTM